MRWKAILPVVIFLGATIALCAIFLDPLAKKLIESGGSRVAGAKVDVSSVHISLTRSSMEIRGLQVADRKDPWKNLVQLERVHFNYMLEPLLTKKFVVQEMSAEGLRWGTPRKTSGELPRRKQEVPAILMKAYEGLGLPQFNARDLKNVDWKSQVNAENLKSLKALDDAKAEAARARQQWEKRIQDLDVEGTARQVQKSVEEARQLKLQGPEDIVKARQALANLRASQEALRNKLEEVRALRQAAQNDLGRAEAALQSADKLKDQDVQGILGKLKLPDLSAKGLARAVFGPVWLGRVEKAVGWVQTARKYMPSKKDEEEKAEKPVPRRQGLTVRFPGMKSWPKFLVEKIKVTGSSEKTAGEAGAVQFSGQILGVTSDPRVYGKPLKIDLRGTRADATGTSLAFSGLLDHTGDVPSDRFTLEAQGMDLAGRKWDVPAYLPSVVAAGSGSARFQFGMAGEQISASVSAAARGLRLSGAQAPSSDAERIVQSAFSRIEALNVQAGAQGTPANLSFSVQTNLDDLLALQMKAALGDEAARLRAQIESQVDALVSSRRNEALRAVDQQKGALNSQLDQKASPLNQQMGPLDSIIGKVEEQIRLKAGEGLKKALPGQLQNIFR